MPAPKKTPKPTTTKRTAVILIEDAERVASAALQAAYARVRNLLVSDRRRNAVLEPLHSSWCRDLPWFADVLQCV